MARRRDLKPEFFQHEGLAELPLAARYLFEGLWTIADREGRLEDRPKRIKAQVYPYDEYDVDELLTMLAEHRDKFITRYEVGDKRYIEIPAFGKHQRPHPRENASEIPPPPTTPRSARGKIKARPRRNLGQTKAQPGYDPEQTKDSTGSHLSSGSSGSSGSSLKEKAPPPRNAGASDGRVHDGVRVATRTRFPYPDATTPPPEWAEMAKVIGVPESRVTFLFEQMRDGKLANGTDADDWNAAWRFWCRKILNDEAGNGKRERDRPRGSKPEAPGQTQGASGWDDVSQHAESRRRGGAAGGG